MSDPELRWWNILVWDQGDMRWYSGGPFSRKEDADRTMREWDRVSGSDSHRVYAIAVFEVDRNQKALRPGDVLGALECALDELEKARRGRAGLGTRRKVWS